jgi:hypothetical protein
MYKTASPLVLLTLQRNWDRLVTDWGVAFGLRIRSTQRDRKNRFDSALLCCNGPDLAKGTSGLTKNVKTIAKVTGIRKLKPRS